MHSTCQLGIAQQRDCVAGFRLLMLQDQTQIKLHDEVMLNPPKVWGDVVKRDDSGQHCLQHLVCPACSPSRSCHYFGEVFPVYSALLKQQKLLFAYHIVKTSMKTTTFWLYCCNESRMPTISDRQDHLFGSMSTMGARDLGSPQQIIIVPWSLVNFNLYHENYTIYMWVELRLLAMGLDLDCNFFGTCTDHVWLNKYV